MAVLWGHLVVASSSCCLRIFFNLRAVYASERCPLQLRLETTGRKFDRVMPFEQILDQAIAMLRRRRRVSYRALKLQFDLDEGNLEALIEALIEAEQLAVDEAGKVLIWTPRAPVLPTTATSIPIRNVLVLLLACVAGAVDAMSYMR